jgi:cholesterol transport system auxiliary component
MRMILLVCLLLTSCAAPPLTLYTLDTGSSEGPPVSQASVVIAVARVTVPDELDTQDIVVRDGSTLRRSALGRWASRLSLAITDRLTERLRQRYPRELVTDRPLLETPAERLLVNIARLDITSAGAASLDADWMVVPGDPRRTAIRDRLHVTASGPVATDQDVVTLVGVVLDKLAAAIDVGGTG